MCLARLGTTYAQHTATSPLPAHVEDRRAAPLQRRTARRPYSRIVDASAPLYTLRMYRPIDPKIDCVFKTLLGSDDRRDLLIHFLNAMLAEDLSAPVAEVDILNPYNERETLDDKLTIVDVKACDTARRVFQVEIQLLVFPDLAPRILYAWADLYSQQLKSGQDYGALQPTYVIWILDQTLFVERPEYAHRYCLRDDQGRRLVDHGVIRLFELTKEEIETVKGFSDKTAEAVVAGLADIAPLFARLQQLGFQLVATPLAGVTKEGQLSPVAGKLLVFTGTMAGGSRDEMIRQAKDLGAKVGSSITGKTDLLICGEKVGATKLEKATKLGVQVLTENEYRQLLARSGES